jgi:hypothetical protein
VVALAHGIHAGVPAPDDMIRPGDNLYVLVQDGSKRAFLKLL